MERRLAVLAGVVIAAVAVSVVSVLVLRATLNVKTPLVIVEGNSMIPTLYSGDLVLIHRPPPAEIKIGDIVVYLSPMEHRLVIHRVVKIIKIVNGSTVEYYYITKGDNNLVNDVAQGLEPPRGVPYRDIMGVVYTIDVGGKKAPLRIPYLGLLTQLLRR